MPDTSLMKPGEYLRRRRVAASMSIADVAQAVATEPRLAHHLRIEWIDLIERDVMPARFDTIVALATIIPFDMRVLVALTDADPARTGPQLCKVCACSEWDPCGGDTPCRWTTSDLCSACDVDLLAAGEAAA